MSKPNSRDKLKKDLKKFFNIKFAIGLLIFLVASLMWFKYIAGLILVIIFVPVTFTTVRYSKMVPHISIESNTGMSAFMGFLFGPTIGLIYGVVVGVFSYVANSFVSATYLMIPLLGGMCAVIMSFFAGMGLPFSTAFAATIVIRTIVAYIVYGYLGTNPLERVTHQTSQMLTNLILYLPLLCAVYDLVKPFVG
ncbi:hypothetical protein JXC34_00150 [Candidatus Woesearchaeota archaeon]|nr:hypothetical protein [Candidatus Woesearchaeota archaeon]